MRQTNSNQILASLLLALLIVTSPLQAVSKTEALEAGRRATAYVISEHSNGHATGTAFCIDSSGIFVTNDHVVTEKGKVVEKITLILAPGTPAERKVQATVLKTNAALDVAILKINRPGVLDAIDLAPPAAVGRLRETMNVMALGFPRGQLLALGNKPPEVSVSTGKITSLRKSDGAVAVIQFDGSINPGNSGGPLLDDRGNVVGVVYAILLDARQLNLAKPVTYIWYMLGQANVVLTPKLLTDPDLGNELVARLATQPPSNLPAVPDAALVANSLKIVRELFAARYADKAALARLQLIPDLIEKANETKDDLVGRYALLTEARELSVGVGDMGSAFYATMLVADDFQFDALPSLTDLVVKMSPKATKAQDAAIATAVGLLVLESKARREEYADVKRLLPLVRANLMTARNPNVVGTVRDRLLRLEVEAADSDKAAVAREKLKSAPDDPAANLIEGRYVCFARRDFERGLPMLAKSGNADLAKIAHAELANPTATEAQKELADLWWDQIAREQKWSSAYEQCRVRAAKWYIAVEPSLTGLARESVKGRLAILPAASTNSMTGEFNWTESKRLCSYRHESPNFSRASYAPYIDEPPTRLLDGLTDKRANLVGWQGKKPNLIVFEFDKRVAPASIRLYFRGNEQDREVNVPKAIAIYDSVDPETRKLLGERKEIPNKTDWMEIPLKGHSRTFVIDMEKTAAWTVLGEVEFK